MDSEINGLGDRMIFDMEIFKEHIISFVYNILMIFKSLNLIRDFN
jgi:hypothetical protein